MATILYDLLYLEGCVELLEDYILSPEIYWSIRMPPPLGAPPFPMLTLGGILLTRVKASCRVREESNVFQLGRLNDKIDALYLRWRSAWEQKATLEYKSRLKIWSNYLEDYQEQPSNNIDRYGYEVGRRVMLQLLARDAYGVPSAEIILLESLDKLLKEIFIQGEFVWESELAECFPKNTFWYLWGNLRV